MYKYLLLVKEQCSVWDVCCTANTERYEKLYCEGKQYRFWLDIIDSLHEVKNSLRLFEDQTQHYGLRRGLIYMDILHFVEIEK